MALSRGSFTSACLTEEAVLLTVKHSTFYQKVHFFYIVFPFGIPGKA